MWFGKAAVSKLWRCLFPISSRRNRFSSFSEEDSYPHWQRSTDIDEKLGTSEVEESWTFRENTFGSPCLAANTGIYFPLGLKWPYLLYSWLFSFLHPWFRRTQTPPQPRRTGGHLLVGTLPRVGQTAIELDAPLPHCWAKTAGHDMAQIFFFFFEKTQEYGCV